MAKKILVIENESMNRRSIRRIDKDNVDVPDTLTEAEEALRSEPYAAVFLDHDISDGVYCAREGFTGQDLARNLRSGAIGEVNKNTLIYGISSRHEFPEAEGHLEPAEFRTAIKNITEGSGFI